MMNEPQGKPRYWFHAKRYGYGWGLPCSWEGWGVLVVWVTLVVGLGTWIATRHLPTYFVFIAVMTATMIVICYAKGEPARWRWGDNDAARRDENGQT